MNSLTAEKEIAEKIISSHGSERPFILAIDGRCAAGKTTFALSLSRLSGAAVVHMDDFFLQPFQRTQKRLETPGENVDWERFKNEVLLPLNRGETARFCPFDCHSLGFKDEISVSPENGVIVEGTYSMNRELQKFYSMRVFMSVSPEIQIKRLIKRNGESGAEIFRKKWIPLEEKYFSAYGLHEQCDYVVINDEPD